ncbi:MAG: hypothetical protein R2681_00415 [Pyrinomonadaceae bacterium]
MKVEFHKTGEKRYAVSVIQEGKPELRMDPAPGFDPLMPHDLLHFVVEKELGLRRGIFGQIALGGTAGTFSHLTSGKTDKKYAARQRRKSAKRDKNLQTQADDYDRSERATVVCLYDWLAHSQNVKLRNRALEMKINAESTLALMPKKEKDALNKQKLAEIRDEMDKLSFDWSILAVGRSISLEWNS